MRIGRHIALLLSIQTRGGATAPALAAEFGVSVRTIYRDVDRLAEAGVPIYADRGNGGGIRLVEGYRTRLTGLDKAESEALSLAGWSAVADALGVGQAAAQAERKMLAAIPSAAASKARRTRACIHIDLARWYGAAESPEHLPLLARAIWDQQSIRIDYTSWRERKEREIDPFGLVLKNAAWYLIGRHSGKLRTYRISEIAGVTMLDRTFCVPEDFELPEYWETSKARFERSLTRAEATLRLSKRAEAMLATFPGRISRFVRDPLDPGIVTFPIESIEKTAGELLAFGDTIEVLGPPDLRTCIGSLAHATAALYPQARLVVETHGKHGAGKAR